MSHEFGENTPRWPGFEPLKKEIKLDFDHYPVKAYTYSFPGQYGTHVDVPAHADKTGRTLEKIQLKECVMPLCVIDCSQKVAENNDYSLKLNFISDFLTIFGNSHSSNGFSCKIAFILLAPSLAIIKSSLENMILFITIVIIGVKII